MNQVSLQHVPLIIDPGLTLPSPSSLPPPPHFVKLDPLCLTVRVT